jgi:hypothetical protein
VSAEPNRTAVRALSEPDQRFVRIREALNGGVWEARDDLRSIESELRDLRVAHGAYRSALRSGEPETRELMNLATIAFAPHLGASA